MSYRMFVLEGRTAVSPKSPCSELSISLLNMERGQGSFLWRVVKLSWAGLRGFLITTIKSNPGAGAQGHSLPGQVTRLLLFKVTSQADGNRELPAASEGTHCHPVAREGLALLGSLHT